MKLVFAPITARRAMVYCQRTAVTPLASETPRIDDKMVAKFGAMWKDWESSDVSWKKQIVFWTNKMLEQVPYEEWGLKTIPRQQAVLRRLRQLETQEEKELLEQNASLPETERLPVVQIEDIAKKHHEELLKVPIVFPSHLATPSLVRERLLKLANDGAKHHKKYMIWSAIGAPLTLPVALLPVLPNLPGFYLVFRCWSHWKALEGANHLKHLIEDNHIDYVACDKMLEAYKTSDDAQVVQNVNRLQEINENGESRNSEISDKRDNDSLTTNTHMTSASANTASASILIDDNSIDKIVESVDMADFGNELKRARRQVIHSIDKELAKNKPKSE